MSPVYCFQFILFSVCVHLFTVFSYFVYYSDRLFHVDLLEEYDYVIGKFVFYAVFTPIYLGRYNS